MKRKTFRGGTEAAHEERDPRTLNQRLDLGFINTPKLSADGADDEKWDIGHD